MGYICQKLRGILGKILGYVRDIIGNIFKLLDIFGKTLGYIGPLNILSKN